jgi:mono/diheme cytochrome c family protein
MKSIYKLTFIVGISVLVLSCKDNLKPNSQYMPNMYEHIGYDTYSQVAVFKGGVEAQLPVSGTIKRGFDVYAYPNSTEGYDAAKLNSVSPLDSLSVKEVEKSKYLFEIYCGICHGNEGNGKGKLVTQGKILGVPSYKDRVITQGSVYHVLQYGINSMGAYSNQLNQKERWMVAAYVMELKSKL